MSGRDRVFSGDKTVWFIASKTRRGQLTRFRAIDSRNWPGINFEKVGSSFTRWRRHRRSPACRPRRPVAVNKPCDARRPAEMGGKNKTDFSDRPPTSGSSGFPRLRTPVVRSVVAERLTTTETPVKYVSCRATANRYLSPSRHSIPEDTCPGDGRRDVIPGESSARRCVSLPSISSAFGV